MTNLPEALTTGRLTLEAHDFFELNPRKGSQYVLFMRAVLHDWSDEENHKILTALKPSLTSDGSNWLIVHERALQPGLIPADHNIKKEESWPLSSNHGNGNFVPLVADQIMLVRYGGPGEDTTVLRRKFTSCISSTPRPLQMEPNAHESNLINSSLMQGW